MLSRRIIPCLDVRNGQVVKGVRFRDHVVIGEIVDLALRYRDEGADELVFYDITASPEQRSVDLAWVEKVARVIDIPFCVAGGIRSVDDARAVLHAGADKISVNSPALERPELIDELAAAFGVQCVVVGIDSLRDDDAEWRVRQYTGDPSKTRSLPRRTLDWIVEAQARGAGEIVLNCMGSDGVRRGYDLDQLKRARVICHVPLVASGGAGSAEDFRHAFVDADVDGALAASVFHSGAIAIPALKRYLREWGVAVRFAESRTDQSASASAVESRRDDVSPRPFGKFDVF
ncbi:MAG TPA: imidazole glycerol phosphate synthase subunit HisF [Rhodanobacter sp.]|nr:imidazole glycerol phosphate synthase subunit HisF [Rhodanobacter sp.]